MARNLKAFKSFEISEMKYNPNFSIWVCGTVTNASKQVHAGEDGRCAVIVDIDLGNDSDNEIDVTIHDGNNAYKYLDQMHFNKHDGLVKSDTFIPPVNSTNQILVGGGIEISSNGNSLLSYRMQILSIPCYIVQS